MITMNNVIFNLSIDNLFQTNNLIMKTTMYLVFPLMQSLSIMNFWKHKNMNFSTIETTKKLTNSL
jgi:high-affinity Fe2+/Pb2+ permease